MPIVTYAILAKETYHLTTHTREKKHLPEGWSISYTDIINDHWGNCFAVFINHNLREIVLSVRGTDNPLNVITDTHLAIGRLQANGFIPNGQKELDNLAFDLLTEMVAKKNYKFTLLGYSLGGVMAELCAVKLGIECITFESPGSLNIMQHPKNKDLYPEKNYTLISTYLSAPNVINTLNTHAGAIFRMYIPHDYKHYDPKHVIKCLLNIFWFDYINQLSSNALSYVYSIHNKIMDSLMHHHATKDLLSAVGVRLSANPITLWEDLEWLVGQHYINNIVTYLSNSGIVSAMDSWPLTPLITVPNAVQENTLLFFSKLFLPFQKDQFGIRNIFDKNGMIEAQIQKMLGYTEHNASKETNEHTATTLVSKLFF